MKTKSMGLVWIVVNDIKKAIQFYTETIGLKLMEFNEHYGWAELEAQQGGSRIGLAQCQLKSEDDILPGQNAVMTFTVENIQDALTSLLKQGVKLIGTVQEVPGHVKLQMASDADGNHFQIVELYHS